MRPTRTVVDGALGAVVAAGARATTLGGAAGDVGAGAGTDVAGAQLPTQMPARSTGARRVHITRVPNGGSADARRQRTGFSSRPSPSISTATTSPGCRKRPRPIPTPLGVPVEIT